MTVLSEALRDTFNSLSERKYRAYGNLVRPTHFFAQKGIDARPGLFSSFECDSIGSLLEDVFNQLIVNPIGMPVINGFMAAKCLFDMVASFGSLLIHLFALDADRMTQDAAKFGESVIGVPYFLITAVLAPLWELVALVTRTLATLASGADAGLTYCGM